MERDALREEVHVWLVSGVEVLKNDLKRSDGESAVLRDRVRKRAFDEISERETKLTT